MQEVRATAALAEAKARQQREANERLAAERAQKKKAKKARRRQAEIAGQQSTFHLFPEIWTSTNPPSTARLRLYDGNACLVGLPLRI